VSRSLLVVAGRAGNNSYDESVGEKGSDLKSAKRIALGVNASDYDLSEDRY
jgi:hypothetical protein